MMTGQIPQPEWFDLADDLDRIAREGACSIFYPPPRPYDNVLSIAGLNYNNENWSWPTESSNVSDSHPFSKCPLY